MGYSEMARVPVVLAPGHSRSQDPTDRISSQLRGESINTLGNGICYESRFPSSSRERRLLEIYSTPLTSIEGQICIQETGEDAEEGNEMLGMCLGAVQTLLGKWSFAC